MLSILSPVSGRPLMTKITFGSHFSFQPGAGLVFENGLRLDCLKADPKIFLLQGLQRRQDRYSFRASWKGQTLDFTVTTGFPGNFGPTRFSFDRSARFSILAKGEGFVVRALEGFAEPVKGDWNTPLPFDPLEHGALYSVNGLWLIYVSHALVGGTPRYTFEVYDQFRLTIPAEASVSVQLPSPERAAKGKMEKAGLTVETTDPIYTFGLYGSSLIVSRSAP